MLIEFVSNSGYLVVLKTNAQQDIDSPEEMWQKLFFTSYHLITWWILNLQKSNWKRLFCRYYSLFQEQPACCIRQLQFVQCAIQKKEAVYLPKDSPVTATWYPIRLPTGQYIYPFTMYCVLYDHATMSSISKKHIIATKTIHLCPFHFKSYIGLDFF